MKTASPASSKTPVNARGVALRALAAWDKARTPLRGLLEAQSAAAAPADRALARDLALGTVQRLNTLDWTLEPLVSRPFGSLDPSVRAALRLGAWQRLYAADRFPAYAAVNETVSAAPLAARGLVNAVLRRATALRPFPEEPVARLALAHSYPEWLVRRWRAAMGEDAERFMESGNVAPPMTLRAHRLKTAPEALAARLASEGLAARTTGLSPDGVSVEGSFSLSDSAAFREGLFSVQDEAAQLAVHALDPQPGESVLDLCAGLGGKSAHIAERMANRGRVVAVDSDVRKAERLQENLRRAGATIVEPLTGDARAAEGLYDRVMVDAPCSGLGTVRRRPDAKWTRSEQDVTERLPALQKDILLAAAGRVKPGGTLVYATCSTEPEENEAVAAALLARPGWTVQPVPCADADGFARLRPHRHGTDGFFIANMRRT